MFGQRALTKTAQDNIMCVSNLRHIHIFTNVLKFGRYDTNLFFAWPSQILMFSLRTSRFNWQLPNVYRVFSYQQLETNLSVSCLEVPNAFVIQVFISLLFFFSFYWVKLKIIFGIVLFSPREKYREGNHLWQWIIDIFITVRPYKLCTKRATKE